MPLRVIERKRERPAGRQIGSDRQWTGKKGMREQNMLGVMLQ